MDGRGFSPAPTSVGQATSLPLHAGVSEVPDHLRPLLSRLNAGAQGDGTLQVPQSTAFVGGPGFASLVGSQAAAVPSYGVTEGAVALPMGLAPAAGSEGLVGNVAWSIPALPVTLPAGLPSSLALPSTSTSALASTHTGASQQSMAAIAAAAAAATVGNGAHVPASLGLLSGPSHSTSAGLPDSGAIAAAAAAAGSAGLHPITLPGGQHKHVFQPAYPLQVDGILNTDGSVVESTDLSPKVRCPECKAGFMRATTMREHVAARHASVKPFRCETCGRGFTEKGHLSLHERSVHNNERPHACELCGRSFSTGSNKRTHFRVVHPIVLPAPGQEALYHAERKDEERRLKADSKGKLGRTKQARNQGDHRSAGLPLPPPDACECARALVEGRDSVTDSDGNQRRIGNFLCVTCGGAFGSLGTVRTHSKRDHGIEIPVASAASATKQRKRSRSASRDVHHADLTGTDLDPAHAAAAAAAAAAVSGMHQHIPLNLDESVLSGVPHLPSSHYRGMEGGTLAQAAMAAASAAASSVVGPAPKRPRDASGMDPSAIALSHGAAPPIDSDPTDVAHITAAALTGNGSSLQSLLSELSSQHAGHPLGVGLDSGLVPGFPAHSGANGASLMAVIAALQQRPDAHGFGSAAEAAAVSSGLSSGMHGSFTPGGAT